jgi:hypothetical protein
VVRLPVEISDLFFVKIVHTSSWAWLPWVLVLGRDIDHSSPPGAELKDQWCYALVLYTGTSGAMP